MRGRRSTSYAVTAVLIMIAVSPLAHSAALELCVVKSRTEPTSPAPNHAIFLRTACRPNEVSIGKSDSIGIIPSIQSAVTQNTANIQAAASREGSIAAFRGGAGSLAAAGTATVLGSITMTPPANGYLQSTGTVGIQGISAGQFNIYCGLSGTNDIDPFAFAAYIDSANGNAAEMTSQRTDLVAAGVPITVNLVCKVINGTGVSNYFVPQITSIFVPHALPGVQGSADDEGAAPQIEEPPAPQLPTKD